jgi:hypothetical protein
VREVFVDDPDVDIAHLLNFIENIEAAASPRPLQGVGGVGNVLQLVKDEMRHEERALEKSRFAEVGDPAVDDDAGVEHLWTHRIAVQFEKFLLRTRQLFLAKPGAQHEAQVGKSEQKDQAADVKQEGLDVKNLATDPFDQARQNQTCCQSSRTSNDDAE